jgi:hypothetical protein
VNADSLPVATANRNGADDDAFVLAVANLDAGRYKVSGTIPSGYAGADVLNVSVAATVGGVAGKAVIDTQVIEPAAGAQSGDVFALLNPMIVSQVFTTAALANAPSGSGSFPGSCPPNWITASGVAAGALNGKGDWSTAAQVAAVGTNVITIGAAVMTNLDTPVSSRSTYSGGPVASVTAPVTAGTVTDKAGYSLAPGGLDAVTVEVGVNARQALALQAAAWAGVLSGAATTRVLIAAANNPGTNRIDAAVDPDGNRTAVTLHLPA